LVKRLSCRYSEGKRVAKRDMMRFVQESEAVLEQVQNWEKKEEKDC
jgi:hypothetical protein